MRGSENQRWCVGVPVRMTTKDGFVTTDIRARPITSIRMATLRVFVGAMRAETNKRFEVLERSMRADRVRAEIPIKKPGGPLGPS